MSRSVLTRPLSLDKDDTVLTVPFSHRDRHPDTPQAQLGSSIARRFTSRHATRASILRHLLMGHVPTQRKPRCAKPRLCGPGTYL